jgi:hypothetical protein
VYPRLQLFPRQKTRPRALHKPQYCSHRCVLIQLTLRAHSFGSYGLLLISTLYNVPHSNLLLS